MAKVKDSEGTKQNKVPKVYARKTRGNYPSTNVKNRVYKTCECGFTGYGVDQFPQGAKGKCRGCWLRVLAKKKQDLNDLRNRPCKTCGKPIGTNDKRQVVCSRDCGHKGRTKEKVELPCCNCGKKVERYKSQLEFRSVFACSAECQRVMAGRAGKDWIASSHKAKERWKRHWSNERRKSNKWIAYLAKARPALMSEKTGWERRCISAANTVDERAACRPEDCFQLAYIQWDEVVEVQFKYAVQRAARWQMSVWERKCSSVARNIKNRFSC